MKHVFISHVHENEVAVSHLVADLKSCDIRVWLDKNDIQPGERWQIAIRNAIHEGNFFVACFSIEYSKKPSTYMNEELTLAIEELRQMPHNRVWFIPVRLNECEVPDRSIGAGETLRSLQWIDLFRDWEKGIARIINTISPFSELSVEEMQLLRWAAQTNEFLMDPPIPPRGDGLLVIRDRSTVLKEENPYEARKWRDHVVRLIKLGFLQRMGRYGLLLTEKGRIRYHSPANNNSPRTADGIPPSEYPVVLSVDYSKERITSNEHDYLLQITVTNNGHRKIEELLIEIEIPSLLKRPNHIYSAEVISRSTQDRMFLRYHEKKTQKPIYQGDTFNLSIPYRVDHDIYWHHKYIFDEVVKVSVSIQDGSPQILEKRIEELQCF